VVEARLCGAGNKAQERRVSAMSNPLHFIIDEEQKVVHFFRDTSTGRAIEHIGLQIIGRTGLNDFIHMVEGKALPVLAETFAGAMSGESPAQLFAKAESQLAQIAKDAGHDFKTNWLKMTVSALYEGIVAKNPALAQVMEAAGTGGATSTPA